MQSTKILSLLRRHPEGLAFGRIQTDLGVKRRDRTKLLEELRRLEKAGHVRFLRKKFSLPPDSGLVRGRFATSRRGFGFVSRADGGEDVFVPARFAEGVLQGDEVEVLVKESGKFGKPEGKVVRVLKRDRAAILGIYQERGGAPFIQAFDSPSPEDMALRSKGGLAPRPGMIIEADRKTLTISKVYGRPEDPGVDTEVIIKRYGLASRFSEESRRESENIVAALSPGDIRDRRDFREWPTVTIDGETAQDFDDAVSVKPLSGGGFLLGVHIADVSHYVKPGTALDREASARGTSVYFPERTLPMLPEILSNDLCSLRPAVPRLTVSVLMTVDAEGRVASAEFMPSLIHTVERLTYTSVFKIFEGDSEERHRYGPLVPALLLMRDLARAMRARRLDAGSLDFDLVEPELIYEEGKPKAVVAAERTEAHRLIEEFMVAANVAVASYLSEKGIPTIYRIHPAPTVADLEKLKQLLIHFGIALPEATRIRSQDLQRVLDKAKDRPEEKFVGIQVLRAMTLATYSPENVGHYGLAKTDYTHFTSPIRRYPDLVVHRILKAALEKENAGTPPLDAVARRSSERERNADEAEQALYAWRVFRLLKGRLGDEFPGNVVDVTKAGLVVELDEYFVDGLLPYRDLEGDTSRRSRGRPQAGRKRRQRFDLGDRVRVILVSCDPVLQRMSLIPAPDAQANS